ncbi:MAG: DDE-type integrase/transposase/recombinase [Alphaproteobacteria bacterium]|nr:DDE-type integrase/transposase/recombinase [Alphaproteobacteria bacterium]
MLSDNSSPYTARDTRAPARQIGLLPLTTPIESPQSNGMAEAFVRTITRDYARVGPCPDAATVLRQLNHWSDVTIRFTRTRRWACPRVRPRTRSALGIDRMAAQRPRMRSGQARHPRIAQRRERSRGSPTKNKPCPVI